MKCSYFEDLFWYPLRYVDIFLLLTLSSKDHHVWPRTESLKLRYTSHPIEWGSDPYRVFSTTSSTYQCQLKLSQCLDIDSRKSLSKFGGVTLPSLSVFYRPAFYRLVCELVDLWDVDLRFQGRFSMLILTMVQILVKLPCVKYKFLETSYLSVFGLCWPIVYRPD